MRDATPEELGRWDELIAANPDGGNVLQCRAFAETKAKYGWNPRYLIVDKVAIMALCRKCPLGMGELWYIPKGPGVIDTKQLARIVKQLSDSPAFAIKIDPELPKAVSLKSTSTLQKVRDIQYNIATVIVDLQPSEDDILASFKQKTRYNVRLAQKKGVTVEPVSVTPETIDQFYKMAKSTYERAGVYVRDKRYFADFWELHAKDRTGQMFFAKFEGQLVAGAFITYLGGSALYKDGASYRDHPELQAPYLMQWEIMKWLKNKGIRKYDLHGVPPKAQIDNPNHPLAGLGRFKTGFSAEIVEYTGTYDIVLHKASYAAWRAFGERFAMAYESRVNKRLFY